MQFQSKAKRTFILLSALATVPDILIAALLAASVDGGIIGFVLAFVGLQLLYLAIWIKNSLMSWVAFALKGRTTLAQTVADHLRRHRFPDPQQSLRSAADYFDEVAANKNNPTDLRILAAAEFGTMKALSTFGYVQHSVRLSMAYEDGIELYKKFLDRFH